MADVHTPEQRSHNMAQIKSKNTKPELLLRKELWKRGARYRLKNNLSGKPDLVFPGAKAVIFVDGCFWHKCPEHFKAPKSNVEFWIKKIGRNVERDQKVRSTLSDNGWLVIQVWEHEIKQALVSTAERVARKIIARMA